MKPGPKKWGENRTYATFYVHERIKCGKANCKCAAGALHGPYWYSYQWDPARARLVKSYIGKERPADLDPGSQAINSFADGSILEGAYRAYGPDCPQCGKPTVYQGEGVYICQDCRIEQSALL